MRPSGYPFLLFCLIKLQVGRSWAIVAFELCAFSFRLRGCISDITPLLYFIRTSRIYRITFDAAFVSDDKAGHTAP